MTELRFGNCRVVEELGSGAISTVYKAVQEPLGRIVAVKALRSTIGTGSAFAGHLEREAHLLGELSHPNVALLFEFVKSDTAMYLVLEHVEGPSLGALLSKRPKLRPEVAAAIGAEVARGLAHAHERGVVHRDMKPSNVLLSKRGDIKVVDFGIAQRERLPSLDEPLLNANDPAAFGTPAYMSPEQILGEFVDARSDLFSLGVVLYQMLAGARPFDVEGQDDRRASAQRIRRDPPPPLHAREPSVPRSLERLVMRLLEKLPADRYASSATVAEELDAYVRAAGRASGRRLIARALVDAGFVKPGEVPGPPLDAAGEPPRPALRPVIAGFGVLAALVVAGGAVIQLTANEPSAGARPGEVALELIPTRAAFLHVVATPWAEVEVDGQRVDVTPFARAIPLRPGRHYVTLTHPEAPPERRVVELAQGETKLLDVVMNVNGENAAAAASAAPSSAFSAAPVPSARPATAKGEGALRGQR